MIFAIDDVVDDFMVAFGERICRRNDVKEKRVGLQRPATTIRKAVRQLSQRTSYYIYTALVACFDRRFHARN
jgi:hypothetical protein